jgi:2-polyprenyl-3-methyl-5-hydroxy-6-metoxy-1,4-benzoquinol methylase
MKEDTILSRILNVYYESARVVGSVNEKSENNKLVNMDESRSDNYSHTEIDGNYLLFFNDIYTTFIRKWMKKVLKKVAWPILKRQVYFNATIRQILYELIQKSHESLSKDRENNDSFCRIEQKIEELSLLKERVEQLSLLEERVKQLSVLKERVEQLSLLEERVEQLSLLEERVEQFCKIELKIEHLTHVEQQLVEQISCITNKIEHIPQMEEKIEQISAKLELQADNSLTSKVLSIEESRIASGLWFNEPIIVGYRGNNEAYWAGTNERILEKNFILLSLARLYESSQIKILDVGSAESLLAYELASLNYSVTAIDIRPIALSHPNLKFIKNDICQPILSTASFDCVIALSTLEHIGLGWYGDEIGEELDCEAVKQIYSLVRPGGNFILTVPYGKRALTPVHRIYDRESLQRLVQNFSIVQAVYGVRLDEFTYTVTDNEVEASLKEHNPSNYLPGAVAMLVCKKIFS